MSYIFQALITIYFSFSTSKRVYVSKDQNQLLHIFLKKMIIKR